MSQLEDMAKQLLETQEPERARALREVLRHSSNPAELWGLAERFYAEPEVSVPAFTRLLELTPEDVAAQVRLGFVYFLMGEDGEANRQLEKARSIAPEHVQVLTLEAALEAEPTKKAQLYRRILEQDPRNEVALGQLRELGVSP